MIIARQYQILDKCLDNCTFINDIAIYGFNAVCNYCPVLLCKENVIGHERKCRIAPDDYRPDWARDWSDWFKGDMKNVPVLKIQQLTEKFYNN